MSTNQFDPHNFIMGITPDFLAEFLKKEYAIDFNVMKDEKAEDTAERFITGIKNNTSRDQIFVDLEYINDVSSPRHIDTILTCATRARKKIDEKDYAKCKKDDERAMWWYMHHRDIFDQYTERNDLEDLSGAKEIILPNKCTKKSVVSSVVYILLMKK